MALTMPTKHGRHQQHPHIHPAPPPTPADVPRPEPVDEKDVIQRLCLELNEAGYTAEISRGQVVVSPRTRRESSNIVDRLSDILYPLKLANGWRFHQTWGVHIPPFPDFRLPDLMVAPDDAEQFDDMSIKGHSALLVAEVCSPGTRSVDWEEKPLDYARAGVPLYLIVDPLAEPRTVVLLSDPLPDLTPDDDREPYRQIVMAEEGELVELPEPFGIKLDTGTLFG
ncbi:Uma2 family endonuclease [Sphaerimonospora cavernae]|uniref:Uma2 family endonuclease n=1 Tax=Sphaerimonospora cavernae TaxID=1740611 RepID=A0ABV6UDK5_9ACTN